MVIMFLYFSLFVVTASAGEETLAQRKNACREIGQNMQMLVDELTNGKANNIEETLDVKTVEKIGHLKTLSEQLTQNIQKVNCIKLVPLIVEHAQKIGQICQHLLIAPGRHNSEEMVAKGNEIGQLKGRVGQIRRLIGTILLEWDIWPKLYNYRIGEGSSDAFAEFVRQMRHRVGQMKAQLGQNNSYYSTATALFEDALTHLNAIASDEDNDEFRKYGQVWTVVQRLLVEAWSEMLRNVTEDLLGPLSKFYGLKLLTEFGKQIKDYEQICADAKAMFGQRKASIIGQIKNSAAMLHHRMEAYKTEIGTTRQNIGMILNKVQHLLENFHYELDMMDMPDTKNTVKDKLAELEQCTKAEDGTANQSDDQLAFSDVILNCLNTEGLEKSIADEAEKGVDNLIIC